MYPGRRVFNIDFQPLGRKSEEGILGNIIYTYVPIP